jgi:hypothetical protein
MKYFSLQPLQDIYLKQRGKNKRHINIRGISESKGLIDINTDLTPDSIYATGSKAVRGCVTASYSLRPSRFSHLQIIFTSQCSSLSLSLPKKCKRFESSVRKDVNFTVVQKQPRFTFQMNTRDIFKRCSASNPIPSGVVGALFQVERRGWAGALTGLGPGCGGGGGGEGRWKEMKKRLAMPAARSTAHVQAASILPPR